jgi:hypothetical protein
MKIFQTISRGTEAPEVTGRCSLKHPCAIIAITCREVLLMRYPYKVSCSAAVLALLFCCVRGFAETSSNVVHPGEVWNGTQGKKIEAHGGGVIRQGGNFYWFGEDRSQGEDAAKRYVSCYTSLDLVHWTSHGDALVLSDPQNLGEHWVLERPKVYFNRHDKQFVMYFHLDVGRCAEAWFCAVETGSQVEAEVTTHLLKDPRERAESTFYGGGSAFLRRL